MCSQTGRTLLAEILVPKSVIAENQLNDPISPFPNGSEIGCLLLI